jgi:hypothetical protein
LIVGVCRICGCTDSTPCSLEIEQIDGGAVVTPCWWLEDGLCSGCGGLEEVEVPDDDDDQEEIAAEPPPLLYDAFNRPIEIGGRR